jgi:two-component system sensor histidine kinase UhpB
VLPIIADMWPNYYLVTNITLLLLPLLIVSLATIELEWRRKERKIFAEREEERQVYISKVLESQENERLRIAQELHDDTIQTLLVIANRAETLVPAGDDMREVRKNAEWIRDTTLETVEGLRRISLDLRPSILGDLGLVPALRWLVDRMNKESGINTRIMVNGKKRKLSPEAEITIFRITQEALNNVKRHSRATEAVVTLEFTPEGCLRISIEDNGQGFRPPKKFDRLASSGKLGLIGMHQRIDFLGGTFAIRSKPGEGTLLLIEARC